MRSRSPFKYLSRFVCLVVMSSPWIAMVTGVGTLWSLTGDFKQFFGVFNGKVTVLSGEEFKEFVYFYLC